MPCRVRCERAVPTYSVTCPFRSVLCHCRAMPAFCWPCRAMLMACDAHGVPCRACHPPGPCRAVPWAPAWPWSDTRANHAPGLHVPGTNVACRPRKERASGSVPCPSHPDIYIYAYLHVCIHTYVSEFSHVTFSACIYVCFSMHGLWQPYQRTHDVVLACWASAFSNSRA